MSASAALLDAAAEVIPGGVNTCRRRSEPRICFRRGEGAYLEDVDGRRFIDYHAAYGAILLGHSHPAVVERVARAIEDTVLFGVGVTEAEVGLARKIVEHVPSVEQVVVCNSGSEAAVDATLVCRYNDLDDVAGVLERHDGDVAAVIVEPIAHNSPGLLPRDGFLEGLRDLCDRSGALLIFDEVITGFRHHIGGFQAIAGVLPDLTTMGKAIANGFPLAAIGGRRELLERFTTRSDGDVHFGGTYNGNAVAVEAGLATIEQLEDGRVHERLFALGERMRSGLAEVAARVGVPAVVGGYGSLFVLCFMDGPLDSYDDVLRNDNELFMRYRRELIRRGVFEMPESLGRSHISAAHTEEDVDRSLEAAEEALRAAVG